MTQLHTDLSPELARETAGKISDSSHSGSVLVGFDGFIDTILQAVDTRRSATEYDRIPTLKAFGERIAGAAGKSTNVEVVVQDVKLGGNGPIMANAMAALGAPVTYCGMTGYPHLHEVFRELAARAKMLSVAEPALTDAYEFEDGKLIVGKHATVADVTYENLVSRPGPGLWQEAWETATFAAMVNWTMLPHLTAIWKRLQQDDAKAPNLPRKTLFFDLADPEKRTEEDLREALKTIADFQQQHDVILGLNEKEAIHAAVALGVPVQISSSGADEKMVADLAANLRRELGISVCLVHPTRFAGAATETEAAVVHGPFTAKPKISTGAGDHFNAGFCFAYLLGLGIEQALQTGVGTSGFYVRNGHSPSTTELAEFLTTL